jgi:Skp family chaperone for outer membrane proteins
MNMQNNRILLCAALLVALVLPAVPAMAESPMRIAVAVPAKIFDNMDEMRAVQQQLAAEQERYMRDRDQRHANVRSLEAARNQLRPDMPQFSQRHNEYINAVIELQAWEQMQQHERQHIQKQHMMRLFERIREAVEEVARREGIHLVLSEPQIPPIELMTPEELRAVIGQRNVLYADGVRDISDEVTRLLNEQYRQQPGGARP